MIKENKKKILAGSGILAIIFAAAMTISGCVATYDHKVMGSMGSEAGIHESYRVELQTDDFILEMRKLDMEAK